MKYSLSLTLALAAVEVAAFPSHMFGMAKSEDEKGAIDEAHAAINSAKDKRASTPLAPGFSASYVSNTGDQVIVVPGHNDLRRTCPGLYAIANHNYIPRSSVATINGFIQDTYGGNSPDTRQGVH